MAVTITSIERDGEALDVFFVLTGKDDIKTIEEIVNSLLIWKNVVEVPDYSRFEYSFGQALLFRIDVADRKIWDTILFTIKDDRDLHFQDRQQTDKVILAQRRGKVIL